MEQAKPVLDRKAAEQMNLNVIKRIDPDVEEVNLTQINHPIRDSCS